MQTAPDPRSGFLPGLATVPVAPISLIDRLRGALVEDLTDVGDVTSQALVPEQRTSRATLVAKADGVLAGVKLIPVIFELAQQFVKSQPTFQSWEMQGGGVGASSLNYNWRETLKDLDRFQVQAVKASVLKADGDRLKKGDVVARIDGNARALLVGERLALNLICRLSGIASQTAVYAAKIAHTKAKLLDTRKTTPLWRDLEKFAVTCGGGENHRHGLYDMVLIKDNHLALWGAADPAGAVNAARAKFPSIPVEVEVVDLAGLKNACEKSEPQMILLDNFVLSDLRAAVAWSDQYFAANPHRKRPLLEASGGVRLETLAPIAESGVDRISVGALTHSVSALDMSLELDL